MASGPPPAAYQVPLLSNSQLTCSRQCLVKHTCTQIIELCASVVRPRSSTSGLMALTINTSTEQKKLTQTPLLKIWVPWMGCNLNRRRGCKCSDKPAQLVQEVIRTRQLFCLVAVCSAFTLTHFLFQQIKPAFALTLPAVIVVFHIESSPPVASGLGSVLPADAGRQAAV